MPAGRILGALNRRAAGRPSEARPPRSAEAGTGGADGLPSSCQRPGQAGRYDWEQAMELASIAALADGFYQRSHRWKQV